MLGSLLIVALPLSVLCVVSSSSPGVSGLFCGLQVIFRFAAFAVFSSFTCFWREITILPSYSGIFNPFSPLYFVQILLLVTLGYIQNYPKPIWPRSTPSSSLH